MNDNVTDMQREVIRAADILDLIDDINGIIDEAHKEGTSQSLLDRVQRMATGSEVKLAQFIAWHQEHRITAAA